MLDHAPQQIAAARSPFSCGPVCAQLRHGTPVLLAPALGLDDESIKPTPRYQEVESDVYPLMDSDVERVYGAGKRAGVVGRCQNDFARQGLLIVAGHPNEIKAVAGFGVKPPQLGREWRETARDAN